ncbi:tRNA (adenosine(37)-N6)-threonylcarbamoyltransferase complex ATPase subunit type 1 TsaE [Flavobacteriaceae bacterium]|nr:tRNA (adenosine(37)-N6)-threonylcarbamoyltransferase complex ATPase subunit type 1 TsaE [Flavobacteriaceae bacterium]
MQLCFTLDEIERAAQHLLEHSLSSVIRIDGDMGAGKTTLISEATKLLGIKEAANSPTFSLVNSYNSDTKTFYHFDFYRLNHPDEALDFGLEEYLESGNLCFLEWAEKIIPHLPLHYDHFILKEQKNGSRILVKKYKNTQP